MPDLNNLHRDDQARMFMRRLHEATNGRRPSGVSDRDWAIYARFRDGESDDAIARDMDVSRLHVRRIRSAVGLDVRNGMTVSEAARWWEHELREHPLPGDTRTSDTDAR